MTSISSSRRGGTLSGAGTPFGGNTLGEEIAATIALFLSVATGFIVAQGWNNAILEHSKRYRCQDNEAWFPWVYAVVATVVGLAIMTLWGYFAAGRLYIPPQQQMAQQVLAELANLRKMQ